jgi:cytochrome oxidase assembly protein ShyY1
MDFSTYKMIEFIMLFGLCFAFGFWQLRSVNKAIKEREAREAESASPSATTPASAPAEAS